jgi:hypothetical protein
MVSTENISDSSTFDPELSDLANVPPASSIACSAANATDSPSVAGHPASSTKPALVVDPANLPAAAEALRVDTLFDPAAAGQAINAVFDKWQSSKKKTDDYRDTLVAMLRDAHGRVPDFKAFINDNTKIARSTAYRLLAITDGRGEEVRKQERERQARVRDVTDAPKSDNVVRPEGAAHLNPADTAAKRRAEYDGVFPEEFEADVEGKVVAELAPPTIGKSILDMTVQQVLALGHKRDDGYVRFETDVSLADDIDLELYDAIEHAAGALTSIHEAMEEALHEQLEARDKAKHQANMAKLKAAEEAAEVARIGRIAWEVENLDEARQKYYDDALANAMEANGDEFDQAAFDASYKPRENGEVDYENPEHEFFTRWYEEHNTIWPGHCDAPVERDKLKQLPPVNLDYVSDIAEARKLLDAAEDRECDKAGKHKARCALAAFLKVALPTSPEPDDRACDYQIDPANCGRRERQVAHDAWWNDNLAYLAAEDALGNKLWAIENPEEAAKEAKEQAERTAAKEKQLIKDAKAAAKNPDKLIEKARLDEQKSAMSGDMDEAKEEARESGERFSDTKGEWVADWLENNWTGDRDAEFLANFKEKWQAVHGGQFPESTHK